MPQTIEGLAHDIELLKREIRSLRSLLGVNFTGSTPIISGTNPNPVPSPTVGDLIYGAPGPVWGRRAIGSTRDIFQVIAGVPDWSSILQPSALQVAPSDLTIAAGVVTSTRSHHRVDTEAAAASDDLDTVNGGVSGRLLVIRPVSSARTIVVKHNTGNILCPGGTDITLDDAEDWVWLLYDSTAAKWYAK